MTASTKKNLVFAAGCLISIGIIVYTTRKVDWVRFAQALRAFELIWLLPAVAAFYFSMFQRAVRWGLLFRPHHVIDGRRTFTPLMIGFAFNSILPARVGEVVRCVHIGRREKIGVATAFATVVAERILDAVTLLVLLAVSFAILPEIPEDFSASVMGFELSATRLNESIVKLVWLSGFLSACVVIFMLPFVQLIAIRLARAWLPGRLRRFASHNIARFARGFHALNRPVTMALVLLHSITLWLLVGVSNLFVAWGFGLEMNLPQAVALVTLIAIFITIPAAPGYWGLYEAGAIFSVLLMGVTEDWSIALAFALTTHLLQYLPIVVIGLALAWRADIRPREDFEPNRAAPTG